MIAGQIKLLNETVLECLNVGNENKIFKIFTEVGVEILNADFGFVWMNHLGSDKLKLVYKSPDLPFTPSRPKVGGRNYSAIESSSPIYIPNTATAHGTSYMLPHIRSFVVIPIVYKKDVYGTMVFCFKKKESFITKKKLLSIFIGNIVAQAVTMHRVVSNQEKIRTIKETRRLLEEERRKVESIAEATHELRTPLAVMKGNVDLVLYKAGPHRRRYSDKAIQNIDKEIDHLSGIISDLALLTSEGGQVRNRINREVINISDLVTSIVKRLKNINHRKNIAFKTIVAKDIFVSGDSIYLEKLFSNLIRNAITYGKSGGWIKVELYKNKKFVDIKVQDNGIGIGAKDLPFVFNRFYRVDKSHNLNGKRTGLGLAIAKWVADVHGGSITVDSKLGVGSTFCVSLPVKVR